MYVITYTSVKKGDFTTKRVISSIEKSSQLKRGQQ